MSRAFVNEDANREPSPRYVLPKRDDPGFDEAAAHALLEGANVGDSRSAELATGYTFGDAKLAGHVKRILAQARSQGDGRLAALAGRFLRTASGARGV